MIDHAFIEHKRAIIAQIERDVTALPNPFLDVASVQEALTHNKTVKTVKRYARKPATRKGGQR